MSLLFLHSGLLILPRAASVYGEYRSSQTVVLLLFKVTFHGGRRLEQNQERKAKTEN